MTINLIQIRDAKTNGVVKEVVVRDATYAKTDKVWAGVNRAIDHDRYWTACVYDVSERRALNAEVDAIAGSPLPQTSAESSSSIDGEG